MLRVWFTPAASSRIDRALSLQDSYQDGFCDLLVFALSSLYPIEQASLPLKDAGAVAFSPLRGLVLLPLGVEWFAGGVCVCQCV